MTNLYTSGLLEYTGSDPVEVSVAEFAHDVAFPPGLIVTIEHYTSGDVLIGEIHPATFAIENHDTVNTRMRVTTKPGQVASGEKIKIIVDDE